MDTRERHEAAEVPDVNDVDDVVLRDLESRYTNVLCPLHGQQPKFEVGPDGSVVERFCCETLLGIVRELQGVTSLPDGTTPPAAAGQTGS
jgi:hypothetical protein